MSREIWEVIKTEARKVRVAKTEERREERGKRVKFVTTHSHFGLLPSI